MCWNWLFHTEMILLVTILKMRRKRYHLIVSLLTIRWYQLFYWMKQSRKYKRMKTKGKQNEFKMFNTFKEICRTFYLLKARNFQCPSIFMNTKYIFQPFNSGHKRIKCCHLHCLRKKHKGVMNHLWSWTKQPTFCHFQQHLKIQLLATRLVCTFHELLV